MIISIFILQLLVYCELYRESRACFPILHFFGESSGLNQTIARIAKDGNTHKKLLSDIGRITFTESVPIRDASDTSLWQWMSGGFGFSNLIDVSGAIAGSQALQQSYYNNIYNPFMKLDSNMTNTTQKVKSFQKNYYDEMIKPMVA